jgi:hypothetical protein
MRKDFLGVQYSTLSPLLTWNTKMGEGVFQSHFTIQLLQVAIETRPFYSRVLILKSFAGQHRYTINFITLHSRLQAHP